MKSQAQILAIWLAIPIFVLVGLSLKYWRDRAGGEAVEFSIAGYDPRNLISGHYLIYHVDYEVPIDCYPKNPGHSAYVCLSPRRFSRELPKDCARFLAGHCEGARFIAGIEQFYIPEQRAKELQELAQQKRLRIRVSVSESGNALIRSLLLDGNEWH